MGKGKNKELVKAAGTAVSNELAGMFDGALASAGDTMDKVDLRIPKMTLIQQMTKQSFNTNKAALGNYIDSVEKNDLGNDIPIFIMSDIKLWEVKYTPKGNDKPEYLGTIDYNVGNKDLRDKPRIPEELVARAEEKGITKDMISQINMINRFYVLKVEEVVAGMAFPYIIDFKRASYPAGVQLKNSVYKMKQAQGYPSYAKVFNLRSEFVQDEHEYYIKTVSAGRMIEKQEIEAVEKWVREMMDNRDAYDDDEADEGAEDFSQGESVQAEVVQENVPKF